MKRLRSDGHDLRSRHRTPGALTRLTVNLNGPAASALNAITAASGRNRTDAISVSLRFAATPLRLEHRTAPYV
jgi:hypothetical protein